MRLKNKYKTYYQTGSAPESFHKRIINFKRPKWNRLQKMISDPKYTKKALINNLCIKSNFKSWDKVKTYYKLGLKNKNVVCNYFDNAVGAKHINRSLKDSKNHQLQDNFLECVVKPEFRIDILLARLGFFATSFQARQYIFSGNVFVNDKVVSGNFFVKKGDLISISNSIKPNVGKNFKCLSPTKRVLTFAEIDYYTNTVVITKNLNDLHLEDIYLLSVNQCELKKIKDFL